ncbi:hypothetical protein IQ238_20175 [Pleurocapsales cyanobacterium LEGE 06147]|nr:hypothetical protein [Pleurocapsales cyanobacterium LEGE 06147]
MFNCHTFFVHPLLYFAYAYESVTLPRMTKNNLETIVTRLFPNRMSLLNSDEADTAIPELTAFWQFLKREYQHRNATPILKFLNKIKPQFKGMMNSNLNPDNALKYLTLH